MRMLGRARSLWHGIRRRDALDHEMEDEFMSHIAFRTEDLVRTGVPRMEAQRRARLEFGSPDHFKDRGAEARGLGSFDALRISWLDVKLGVRMLGRYPGLTLVGTLAMAFAVAGGAGAFEFVSQIVYPHIPLPHGDRIVAAGLWNTADQRQDTRLAPDLAAWRRDARTLQAIGGYRDVSRNLVGAGGLVGEPVFIAEMTASGFSVAGVQPLLGRTLARGDESMGAPRVVVLGYALWTSRFHSDPGVIGTTVSVGADRATVIGVMPRGFAFPVAHAAWIPLRSSPAVDPRARGPAGPHVFAKLAPGATLDQARAELQTIHARLYAGSARDRAALVTRVVPFGRSLMNLTALQYSGLMATNLFLVMFMVLICANVALLLFARAATREAEIVVRTALGATRGRIIAQLFAEAMSLGFLALVLGLGAASGALRWAFAVMLQGDGRLPFWMHAGLRPSTIIYTLLITLLGTVVAGVLPALKVTQPLDHTLRRMGAGGGGLHFGGVWTAVIVAQVAITVAFPVSVFFTRRDAVQVANNDLGFAARGYLGAQLDIDDDSIQERSGAEQAQTISRFQRDYRLLAERLRSEPNVSGVTFTSVLPGSDHPQRLIQVDGAPAGRDAPLTTVSSERVDASYFSVLGATPVSGRGFTSDDATALADPVVVNQNFVRDVLGGANPIGRRVRYMDSPDPDAPPSAPVAPGPWHEVVGVVPDLGMTDGSDPRETGAGLYEPVLPAAGDVQLIVHLRHEPEAFTRRLRRLAASVDPALQIRNALRLDRVQEANLRSDNFWVTVLGGLSAMALLLSLASIYAVMSFAVARRTREIGIRVALGAERRRILTATFARPLAQVSLGVVTGALLAGWLASTVLESLSPLLAGAILGYAVVMLGVCLLACIVPTQRALRIQPTEALKAV